MYRLIFLILLAACQKKEIPQEKPSYPIKVIEVKEEEIPLFIEALGHADPLTSVNISSRVEGELIGIHFIQGQEVKKGDLLFTIDPKPYLAKVKQAKGNLEKTLANLSLAEEKVRRFRILANDEYYSQIDYQTLQANFAALLAEKIANEGELDEAKINLDSCSIFSPLDGKTGILKIDQGNLISPNSQNSLLTINQMNPIFVTFSIPEIELYKILKVKTSEVKVIATNKSFEKNTLEGSLYMLDNTISPGTGTVKLKGIFPNEDQSLFPGQFVQTRILLPPLINGIMIPSSAVQMTQDKPIVFVMKEDKTVEKRVITLGVRKKGSVVVTDGLKAGENVVTEGQINLYSGAKVFLSRGT